MIWTNIDDEDPPHDRELLMYYENGLLDKGYVVGIRNSLIGWKFPSEKIYLIRKWVLITDD